MRTGELLGAFALTEPDSGSDPGSMTSRARRDGSDWILKGAERWNTNCSIADIVITWVETDHGIRGFIVPTDAPVSPARQSPANTRSVPPPRPSSRWIMSACLPTRRCPTSPVSKDRSPA